ncbi:SGNH/GDSL hydrolase family protein [Pseudarthrobacter sp. NamB4]|uniref:SGNH/GDSL hydrolase family protein n=1 Tax=Pseudarthrobacter sp. NamB4 TaxID=2576837 RepID=UPI0010FD2872|nr:SGNH/GDSL hydrolase family protein [Pseudarthrobacter sp. NamB4]TLM75854.1 SGNH/GDSL hydrolase family protein [Pseudarthrobacter sp. NamB4]
MSRQNPGDGRSALSRTLVRILVLGITAGVLLAAPGQPRQHVLPASPAQSAGSAPAPGGRPPSVLVTPSAAARAAAAPSGFDLANVLERPTLLPGDIYRNPVFGRDEVVVANVSKTAVLIGDSQSEPDDGWPRLALGALGYNVHFCGYGGTGFTAANGRMGNYIDALERGDWLLPVGTPGLVVVQGGGNDASRGATDAHITANANRLLKALKDRYPSTQIVMVGTLGRGANNGGGRRSQVDSLLAAIAGKQGIPFASVGDWLTRYKLTHRLADTVHMDSEGRKTLGVLLERRLRELQIRDLKAATGTSAARTGDVKTMG